MGLLPEIAPCQSDATEKVNASVFPISRAGNETPVEHLNLSAAISTAKESAMIDPPTTPPEDPKRKVELDQTVDFAIQLLVEEAHTIGWQRAEFLTAITDSANARLSVLEEERQLDGDMAEEPTNKWPGASEK
ncbi:hypothetical protein [Rhizobium sp. PL01]|uniref:hypothetical protein n=1 Tax=Rhizobium sp. PL01 TaxID=3085631 RepID=UPI002980E790|nr:hypothetical protein [Rhizobium sp. PL01]MDW5312963.1 hypothetical protein [Rhizobium sp. PL01]